MKKDRFIAEFVKSRDTAFTRFVLFDDWEALMDHLRRYGQDREAPKDRKVLAASIYKAVQECTNIAPEVKAAAKEKCLALGFKPYMPVCER